MRAHTGVRERAAQVAVGAQEQVDVLAMDVAEDVRRRLRASEQPLPAPRGAQQLYPNLPSFSIVFELFLYGPARPAPAPCPTKRE